MINTQMFLLPGITIFNAVKFFNEGGNPGKNKYGSLTISNSLSDKGVLNLNLTVNVIVFFRSSAAAETRTVSWGGR